MSAWHLFTWPFISAFFGGDKVKKQQKPKSVDPDAEDAIINRKRKRITISESEESENDIDIKKTKVEDGNIIISEALNADEEFDKEIEEAAAEEKEEKQEEKEIKAAIKMM